MGKKTKAVSVGSLVSVFVAALVGIVLLNPFASEVVTVTNTSISNVTGAANTITGLLPLFFAILIIFVFIVKFTRK